MSEVNKKEVPASSALELEKRSTRDGFGDGLLFLGEQNLHVVALSANLAESTRVLDFAKKWPERYFETGVAEQNMAGVAAGLALSGKIPFMTSFAAFSPATNWSQIRLICYNQANVKIVSTHAGLTVGADGAMHQALEDIALMRVLPNMTVLSPSDANEAKNATIAAASCEGPVYLRLGREPVPVFTKANEPFEIGKIVELRSGKDIALIATGIMVHEALKAADALEQDGISAAVLNCHTIKPLDNRMLIKIAQSIGAIVTIEEHQVAGGLGSAVAEVIAEQCPIPMARIGVKDSFGESGKPAELLAKYGLDVPAIAEVAKRIVRQK